MHSTDLGAAGGNVPAFLTKLMRLVEDPNCDDLICWNVDGTSFFIHDQTRFARELLPMYFKHNNMQSFIRQLNMYGFRKKQLADQGGLKCESDTMEFYHQYFLKGQETLLEYIKRKVSTSTSRGGTTSTSNNSLINTDSSADVMHEILTDVRAIRGKQESVDSLLNDMKRENEALWREVAFLRQKHMKQQQVVEKLIQFLVTLVQPGNRNINVVQRKLPLMLYDSSVNNSNNSSASSESPKIGRFTRQYSSQAQSSNNSTGPVIRDVTDSLESRVAAESVPSPINQRLLNPEFCEAQQSRESPLPEQPIVNSPAVDSPLNTEEIMEPLSVLVPLQTPTNTILMLPTGNDVLENEFLNSPTSADPTLEDLVDSETNNNDGKEVLSPQPPSSTQASRSDPPSNVPLVSEKNNLIIPDLIESPTPSTSNNPQMTVALNEQPPISFSLLSPGYKRFDIERSSFTDHLEGIDNELDWLSEQLSGNSYSIDTSNLLGLFGADDTVPGNNLPTDSFRFAKGDVTGNEVVQYLPNLMETESAAANEKDLANDLKTSNEENSDLTSTNDCIAELLGVSQEELFRNLMVRNQSDNRAATQLQYISNLQQNPPKDSNFEIPRTIQRKKTATQSSLRAKKKKTS